MLEWKGGMNEFRNGVNGRLRNLDKKDAEQDKEIDRIDRELTKVTTKIGIAAAGGSILGGAIVTLILTVGTKALGG